MSVVIGWDIGGAHLKAVRVTDGRIEAAVQAATPLWLGLDSLEAAFDGLLGQLGGADGHAVTMTGELCDAFASRTEGVAGLAAIAARHLAPATAKLYAGRAGFVELGEAASHAADIASANWHASAELVALKMRDALFIDIGSTTADLIPVIAGRVAAGGCSAPMVKSPDEADATLGQMKFRRLPDAADGRREALVMLRHPNNSGMQMDQISHLYTPARYIDRLAVFQGDELVFSMEGGISISEDPNFRFSYAPNGAKTFRVEASDSNGVHFSGAWPADRDGA